MKKTTKLTLIITLLVFCGTIQKNFAQSLNDIINSNESITYLGVDFSDARLIGDPAANAAEIKVKYFGGINGVVVGEPKKFDLATTFSRADIPSDLTFVTAQNGKANVDKFISFKSDDAKRFTDATVASIVKGYSFEGKTGVGLLFIVETMNKMQDEASIYVTFLDMGTKKILATERMTGKAAGFGFRNFWVRPISDILKEIQKRRGIK
jgi:hypothetical protein